MISIDNVINDVSERLDKVIIGLLETITVDEVEGLKQDTKEKITEVLSCYPGEFDDHIYNVLDACLNNERR